MAWRNNLTCDTLVEAAKQLASVFKKIGLARKAKQIFLLIGMYSISTKHDNIVCVYVLVL